MHEFDLHVDGCYLPVKPPPGQGCDYKASQDDVPDFYALRDDFHFHDSVLRTWQRCVQDVPKSKKAIGTKQGQEWGQSGDRWETVRE